MSKGRRADRCGHSGWRRWPLRPCGAANRRRALPCDEFCWIWQFAPHSTLYPPTSDLRFLSSDFRPLVIGLGGGLLAHLVYGLTDAVALGAKPGLLFWMLLGLIAALYEQTRASQSEAARV